MKYKKLVLALLCFSSQLYADDDRQLQNEIKKLQQQTQALQAQLNHLQQKMVAQKSTHTVKAKQKKEASKPAKTTRVRSKTRIQSTQVQIHYPSGHPESVEFYPTALIADNRIVTYIAGTPVVTAPYLGDRPAFDGSDYIVNISSINRDIRLMQQRRRLYRAFRTMGYPLPQTPIVAISGKIEPIGMINSPYNGNSQADLTLGSNELDVAATLNENVQGFMSIAYDESPPEVGPRINNSAFSLNLGFVNIGNLDKTPFYFTAGQLYVPFGRYASSMISAPLTMKLARTKARPFILGYKSMGETGPFAAAYIYRSDTTLGRTGVGGGNLGYVYQISEIKGEIGAGYIGSIDDAAGMQNSGALPFTTFGGFGSFSNGSEAVRKTPAFDLHGNVAFDRFNLVGEWVESTESFRPQDLSFNGQGARPAAALGELDMTFRAFNRPASIGVGYQWTKEALALNLPQHRISGVFNISIWKDTVESLEYRHDIDYKANQYANGAAPVGVVNANTVGTGRSSDTVSAQIGVYF